MLQISSLSPKKGEASGGFSKRTTPGTLKPSGATMESGVFHARISAHGAHELKLNDSKYSRKIFTTDSW